MDILSHYKNSFTSSVCTTTPVLAVTSLGACSLFFYFSYLGSDEIATSENVLLALIFIAVALYFASKNKSLIHHAILLLKHSWDGNVKQFRFSKSPAKPVQWFIGDSDGKRTKVKKEKIVREGVEFYSNGDFYEGEFHEGRSNGPEWGVQINHSGIEPFRYSKCWLFYFKAQVGLFCGQEVENISSYAPSEHTTSSLFKGVARNGSPPWRDDDKEGHYMFELGENLTSRYKIHSKMGEGTFGQVLECWDRERKEMVAVKIVRGVKKYREAAMIEIEVLQHLGKHDKGGNRCVQIRNWFDYRNHICIVFEKLGPSLYDFLRKNNYRSFPIDLVREIGRQLLECVAFMHDLHMIHTDLKPENILLVSPEYLKIPDYKSSSRSPGSFFKRVPKSSAIKVIDFGSTTYEREDQNYIVSTRHYRAPEVILGLGWSYPCDVWSVGCILVELCTGEALFQTHENLEHLAMMERVLGPIPQQMLKRADRHAEKYVRRGRLVWPEGATSRESIKAVMKLPRLQNLIMQHVDHSAGDLIHLLQGLLRYDPFERLTARDALRHSFFMRDHLRR